MNSASTNPFSIRNSAQSKQDVCVFGSYKSRYSDAKNEPNINKHIFELNNGGHRVGKLSRSKMISKNNKLVKSRFRCQRCVLIANTFCRRPSASAGTDFSNDAFASAAELEDNNEVIENLSNLTSRVRYQMRWDGSAKLSLTPTY